MSFECCVYIRMRFLPAVGYALDVLLHVLSPAVACALLSSITVFWTSASLPARRQSSVLDRASGFWSPASSSLVVFASRVRLRVVWWSPSTTDSPSSARCACRGRRLLEILQLDVALSSSVLAVIMVLHDPPTMALHGSRASLHARPCFDKLFARPRADPRVLLRTLLQNSAALARRRAGWFAGLTRTTCVPSSLCAWRSFCFPRTLVILLW